jgi:hypothetical protein
MGGGPKQIKITWPSALPCLASEWGQIKTPALAGVPFRRKSSCRSTEVLEVVLPCPNSYLILEAEQKVLVDEIHTETP